MLLSWKVLNKYNFQGRLFQFNWNVADILSQEIKKIKERYPYFELEIEQDAVRKPLMVKHEES